MRTPIPATPVPNQQNHRDTLHRSIMIKTLNTLFSPQNELLYFVQLTGVLQDGKEREQYKKIPLLTNYYMTHAIKKTKKIQQQKYPSKVS